MKIHNFQYYPQFLEEFFKKKTFLFVEVSYKNKKEEYMQMVNFYNGFKNEKKLLNSNTLKYDNTMENKLWCRLYFK